MKQAIRRVKLSLSTEEIGAALLMLGGAILRLRQYLTGRSLWADEAMLALNIVERDVTGLFQPLEYDQGAPIGFLLVEKLLHSFLGAHEFVLRLFPLLVGLASLGLFYLLLRRFTNGVGLLVALALFVFNPRLIYYSSEVKQYIGDVAVTIGLLLIAAPVFHSSARRKDFLWLTLAGLVALWFSHPALFVLAGIGIALLIVHFRGKVFSRLGIVAGMGLIWVLEIALLYLLILRDLSQNAYMQEYWQGAFLPIPPWSDVGWFMRSLQENIGVQFGIPYAVFPVFLLMLMGWALLWFRQREFALVFAFLVGIMLTASALKLYPVFERMILFLIPIGLLLIGKAVEAIAQRVQRFYVLGVLFVLFITGYLLYGPFVTSMENFVEPRYYEHIRPSMSMLRDSWKDGDVLYVSYGAVPAFRFYAPFFGLEGISYVSGQREDYESPEKILSRLHTFQGKPRLWLLFSHVYENEKFNERELILDSLSQKGEKKREFRVPGTSVFLYLYDLRN